MSDKVFEKQVEVLKESAANSPQFQKALIKLWQNPKFSGSFSGSHNTTNCLKYDLGIEIQEDTVKKILTSLPTFSMFMRLSKRHKTRKFTVHGSFQVN